MTYTFSHQDWFDGIEHPNFAQYSGNLIIYGAGFQGALTIHLLEKTNIKVLCFLDKDIKKHDTFFQGYPVLSPEKGKEKYPTAAVIITANNNDPAFLYVKNDLGFKNVFTPFSLFLDCDYTGFNNRTQLPEWYMKELSKSDITINYHLDYYMRKLANFYALPKTLSDFKFVVDFSVSEVCNLRCKECTSLMPYFKTPKHFDVQRLKRSLDVFCKNRYVKYILLEGGETFVYPQLKELVEYILESFEQVEELYLLSNGTILPSEEIMTLMQNPRVAIRFSYYGEISSKLDEFASECDKRKINYLIQSQKWSKFAAIPYLPHSEEELINVATDCCKLQGKGDPYMKDGVLYRCPFAANGTKLGLFEAGANDCVDLMSDEKDLQQKINEFVLNPKPVTACYYCNGRGYTNESVPVAQQLQEGEIPQIRRV